MSKKTKNPNRTGFLNRVEDMRQVENDVDKVLQAARLKRIESTREPLSARDIIKICAILAAALVFCTVLVLGWLSGNFVSALLGVGGMAFFGLTIAAMAWE